MAHLLTERDNGIVEMFYQGDTPWHGLGTPVKDALTSQEALEAAHLDWQVGKENIATLDGELIEEFYRTFREDNNLTLGVVKDRYTVFQNHDAFSFMDELVQGQEAMFVTAGSIKGGKVVWALCKLPGHIEITKKDIIENFILLMISHDGSKAVHIKHTPVRVVCNNTLSAAMGSGLSDFSTRHTAKIFDKTEDAREALGILNTNFIEFGETCKSLVDIELTEEEATQYFIDCLGIDEEKTRGQNIIKEVLDLYNNHDWNNGEEISGTAWAAYNSLTHYIDHNRTQGENLTTQSVENRQISAMFGQGSAIKKKALAQAMQLAHKDLELLIPNVKVKS